MLQPSPPPKWPFRLIVFIAPFVFFMTEHNVRTSLAEAFTQTAEEMLATAEGGNMIRRISYPLFGVTGMLLVLSPTPWKTQHSPVLLSLIACLAIWCGLSIMWSIDPGMTFRRLLVLYCTLLAAWGTAKQLDLTQLLWLTLVVNLGFLLIGFVSEVLLGTFRPWAGDHRFSGTLHPNTQGLNLASLCFASVALVRQKPQSRLFLWTTFWVGMIFLYLTKSRTSFLGVILTLGIIWSLSVPFVYKFVTVFVCVWFGSLVMVLFLLIGTDPTQSASDAALMGREEQAESLTGRLPLWTELSAYAGNRPLLGHGYDSFWVPRHIDEISSELGWGLREAHNSYLEALLSIGLIGLLLALCLGLYGVFQASQAAITTKQAGFAFLVALLCFGMINAFTESSMMSVSFYTYILASGLMHLAIKPIHPNEHLPRTFHFQSSATTL